MATRIKVSETSYQEELVTLNGKSLYLTFAYNTSDDVSNTGIGGDWYMDIADRNKVDIISGVKILPIQNLTKRYLQVHKLLGGDLWCMNVKDTSTDINKDNFGTDRKFQLWYLSDEEMETYGV